MDPLGERFTSAWAATAATVDVDLVPAALAAVCVQVLPFDAAGLSLHGEPGSRLPLGSSSEEATSAERLEFTYGDGPCFLAMKEGRPVATTEQRWREQWPLLAEEHFARTSFHGGLAVPLRMGAERFGVLDLYNRNSRVIDGSTVIDGQLVAALVTSVLLKHVPGADLEEEPDGDHPHRDPTWWRSPGAVRRRHVWMAAGMVGSSLSVSSQQALAILRAHAFVNSRALDEVALDVVERRLGADQLGAGDAAR